MVAAYEATGLIPVAIDGKSARAAKRNTATGCLHVVTAWAAENRLVPGTASAADGSDEIAAIPELLRTSDLAGAIVTIDAAGCRVENARIIRKQEGHYLPAVKDNQLTSYAGTAAEIAGFVRGHWAIENGLHRVLDVVFREDRSRVRRGNAGANLAMIRRVATSLLRRAPGQGSHVTKCLKAGWDNSYIQQMEDPAASDRRDEGARQRAARERAERIKAASGRLPEAGGQEEGRRAGQGAVLDDRPDRHGAEDGRRRVPAGG